MISIDGSGPGSLVIRMADFFGPEGRMVAEGGEFRQPQLAMAEAVAEAVQTDACLAVEAGTGVGKSLAYLVPSVIHALSSGRRAVVSTHTINLQEQLMQKDLPTVSRLIGEDFPTVLLKGRRNYLCPQRLRAAMRQTGELFTQGEEAELRRIADWAVQTRDGTLGDLPFSPSPRVWAQVCSETRICTARRCSPASCFFQEAWSRASQARVIVVNHMLYFTLLAGADESASEEGFLFPGDFAIFDEAHTLEAVAARQLGFQVSEAGMQFELQRLYNPRTRKGLFAALRDSRAMEVTEAAQVAVESFFSTVNETMPGTEKSREWRVQEPDFAPNLVAEPLLEVESHARKIAKEMDKEEDRRGELEDLAGRLQDARKSVDAFLTQAEPEHVYWIEREGAARTLSFIASPVDVAPILAQRLFHGRRAAVLTSATLGAGSDDLSYFRHRVGADLARAEKIGSPFDFQRQMEIHLVRNIPAPGTEGYEDAIGERVFEFLTLSDGRAFVLFTSYKLLRKTAETLKGRCEEKGWRVFVQGEGMPRRRMLTEFAKHGRGVLFGTESFWTGVDVPGEALSNVIITRLPFAVPDHPMTAARLEKIEADGGNPFMEYSVPEAVLKLRQGVGRLIRRASDKGMIVVLDNRVLTKRYGRIFLKALPDAPRVVHG